VQRRLQIAATAVWAVILTPALLFSLLGSSLRCDDTCASFAPGEDVGWSRFADSWQWTALWLLPAVGLTIAIVALTTLVTKRAIAFPWLAIISAWLAFAWVAIVASG
jgi:hypothetical protein